MKRFNILVILIFLILVSCTTTKFLTSNVNPNEISDLKFLEPYSYISKISKGNRGQLDDSLSIKSKQLIIKVLESLKGQIPITGEIILSDTSINRTLEKEFESLILTADRSRNISNLKITPTIDKILEANGVRFGLLTVGTGFTRLKGNYGKQVAKGAALGILTLGMYVQTPIKAYSTIYVMIVDSKEDNISFFRKSYLQDKEPLDENVLTKQFKDIFKGYFLTTK
jgi:hypothetical protein